MLYSKKLYLGADYMKSSNFDLIVENRIILSYVSQIDDGPDVRAGSGDILLVHATETDRKGKNNPFWFKGVYYFVLNIYWFISTYIKQTLGTTVQKFEVSKKCLKKSILLFRMCLNDHQMWL